MSTTTIARTSKRPPIIRRMLVMLIVVGLLAAGLIFFHRFKAGILKQVTASIAGQAPTIATTAARSEAWQPSLSAVGTLRASEGTDLAAEIAGIVDEQRIQSGQDVAAGALLVRLRPNDDDAKLAQLQATADLAQVTYNRDVRQLAAQGVAQSVVDTDAGNLKAARAQVQAQMAVMAQKVVRAPFAGRLGLRQVDRGQYLAAGTTIVTLQALDPMLVDFYLPQQALGEVSTGQAIVLTVDAFPGRDFAGQVSAINPKADSASRMIQLRATLPNPDRVLLPGMYAQIRIATGTPVQRVTVPQSAINFDPYGTSVYLVRTEGGKLVARQRFVTTGEMRGDQVAVLKGLDAGATIAAAGQLKLYDGVAVIVNNAVLPTDAPAPVPTDR